MGCDIHLYLEKKVYDYPKEEKKNRKWLSLDKWVQNEDSLSDNDSLVWDTIYKESTYNGGRNYNLFTALANVRSGYFDPPAPFISAPKGLPHDVSIPIKMRSEYYGSDGHSHSWLTLKELKEFDFSRFGDTCKEFIDEVIPKMEAQEVDDDEVRIVFWFDN